MKNERRDSLRDDGRAATVVFGANFRAPDQPTGRRWVDNQARSYAHVSLRYQNMSGMITPLHRRNFRRLIGVKSCEVRPGRRRVSCVRQ